MWRHMLSSLISVVCLCVVMSSFSVSRTALLFTDRIMNGDTSLEDKKQEGDTEKLPEETSTVENHWYVIHDRHHISHSVKRK